MPAQQRCRTADAPACARAEELPDRWRAAGGPRSSTPWLAQRSSTAGIHRHICGPTPTEPRQPARGAAVRKHLPSTRCCARRRSRRRQTRGDAALALVGGAPRHARRRGAPDTHPPRSIWTKRVTGWSHRAMAAEAASVDHLAMATRDFRSTVSSAAPVGFPTSCFSCVTGALNRRFPWVLPRWLEGWCGHARERGKPAGCGQRACCVPEFGIGRCGARQPPTVADRMPGLRPPPSTASQGHSAIQLRSQPSGPMAFPRTRSADHDQIEGQDGSVCRTAPHRCSGYFKDASRSPEPLRAAVLGGAKGPPAP